MNSFYNAVMALQRGHSGAYVYHLPLGSPRKKTFLKEDDFRCCNGSSIEAFSLLNSSIYYHNDSTLWVNLYVPSKVSWAEKGVELEQSGNFPSNPVVDFRLSAKKKATFALNLLAPSWAKKASVIINDEKQNIDVYPNSFIRLERTWKSNDRVRLEFDYDFYIKTMPDDKNVVAIYYGPMLLAFENSSELILKGNQKEILSNLSIQSDSSFHLKNGGTTYVLRPLYEIEGQSYGVYAT